MIVMRGEMFTVDLMEVSRHGIPSKSLPSRVLIPPFTHFTKTNSDSQSAISSDSCECNSMACVCENASECVGVKIKRFEVFAAFYFLNEENI